MEINNDKFACKLEIHLHFVFKLHHYNSDNSCEYCRWLIQLLNQ